ncbi:MAG: BspA family leucine-rich repeat surface protein, partial [Allobaculum sp.]|nr:BspA family leucine-rich repeat surface protein [Allobaculum sp.]
LKSLDLSKWNISSVEDMNRLFASCEQLENLNLSNWQNSSSLKNMEDMFYGCEKLKSLNLASWDVSNVEKMSCVFTGCSMLESLNLSGWQPSKITNTDGMFCACYKLKELDLSQWNTSKVEDMNNMFYHCYELSSLKLSNLWNMDQVKDTSGMFQNCYALKSLDVSNWGMESVEDISGMFDDCSSLEILDVSNWTTPHLKQMIGVFYRCSKLKSLDLSSWDTSNVKEMWSIFYECSSLETLNLSSWNTLKGEVDEGFSTSMFENCNKLKKIEYNENCQNVIALLPEDSQWYQNDEGPYSPSELPSLDDGKIGILTRYGLSNEEPKPTKPSITTPNVPTPSEEDNKPSLDEEEEDPNLTDDNENPKPSVDPDPTPTQTGDSSTVIVDLYIKNNKALAGITTEDGELPEEELRILETYLNTTPNYNPNDYSVTIMNASVSKNRGNNEKYNFELTVAITLKEESRINFVINKLEKKMKSEDAAINESGLITLSFEDAETTPSYTVTEVRDKIIIEGLLVKDAFGSDNQIDGSFIKGILDDEGYEVSGLDFKSTQSKNSTFILHDLTSLVTIEISANSEEDKQPEPENPTKPADPVKPAQSSTRPSTGSNGGSTSTKPKPAPSIPATPSVVRKPTYRFFNTITGEHFYTSSEAERDELMKDSRWNNEGQGWISPETSDFLVYRLCNPNTGEHHYTTDKNEYDTLQTYGWEQEGIGFYSADPQVSDIAVVYRLFNPKANDAGSHHYTMNEQERNTLVNSGWRDEGIAWYGIKSE